MHSRRPRRAVALFGGSMCGVALLWGQGVLAQDALSEPAGTEKSTLISVKVNPDGSVAVTGITQEEAPPPAGEAAPPLPPPAGPPPEPVPPAAGAPPADGKAPCPCPNPCAPLPPEPGRPIPQTKPFEPPPQHPLKMLCKIHKAPPLQKPPFAGEPVDSLKGMAAGINAVQLDTPNRVLAAEYLGTVDCVLYPQAREMLVQTMLEDPAEEVRYAAVRGLEQMLSRGPQQQERKWFKNVKKFWQKHKHPHHEALQQRLQPSWPETERYDDCRGCCDDKTLNALAKVAYGTDQFGCPIEPSERVRQAAIDALQQCPCQPAPMMYATAPIPAVVPPPPVGGAEEAPPTQEEAPPRPMEEAPGQLETEAKSQGPSLGQVSYSAPSTTPNLLAESHPVLKPLRGYCPVALKSRRFVKADPQYAAVYEGRTYFFASDAAKAEFERFPEAYAPAFSGHDPIERADNGREIEGIYLREFDGRFYLFSSKENWEKFQAAPERYALIDEETQE